MIDACVIPPFFIVIMTVYPVSVWAPLSFPHLYGGYSQPYHDPAENDGSRNSVGQHPGLRGAPKRLSDPRDWSWKKGNFPRTRPPHGCAESVLSQHLVGGGHFEVVEHDDEHEKVVHRQTLLQNVPAKKPKKTRIITLRKPEETRKNPLKNPLKNPKKLHTPLLWPICCEGEGGTHPAKNSEALGAPSTTPTPTPNTTAAPTCRHPPAHPITTSPCPAARVGDEDAHPECDGRDGLRPLLCRGILCGVEVGPTMPRNAPQLAHTRNRLHHRLHHPLLLQHARTVPCADVIADVIADVGADVGGDVGAGGVGFRLGFCLGVVLGDF